MSRQLKIIIFAVALAFSLDLTAAIFQSDFWGDLLGPVGDLLSAGIIFCSVLKSNSNKFFVYWNLFGLAVLFWASADILWAIYDLVLHKDPGNSILISMLYLGTTVIFLMATIIYCANNLRKWDSIQLLLDAVAMSISVLWLIWVLVFDKRYDALGLLVKDNVFNTICITLDTVQLIGIMVWCLSVRGGKISLYLRIISGAIYFYTMVDLCYFYLYMKNMYIPNSIIDACFLAALLVLAVGVRIRFTSLPSDFSLQDDLNSNIGYRKKGWLLLPAPALILIFKGLDVLDLLIFVLIIFLHERLSSYIQTAISNKKLLAKEVYLNNELEQRISERTKDVEQKNKELEYISAHDDLTGLHNRRYFMRVLKEKAKDLSPNEKLTLLFWDVTRFKVVNDTYGHPIGDQILIALAGRMQNLSGKNDVLARFGGDEFVFAFSGDYRYDEIEGIAKRIVDLCNEPIQIRQYTFQVTISLGISVIPLDTRDSDTLLQNADIAMYQAKKQGLNKCIAFYSEIHETMQRKHLIEVFLKRADYNKEFKLFYQPQFRAADQELIGMEALIRWNCPELGVVSPAEFIPIAEEADLIIPIGNWVMKNAICQISEWNHLLHANLKMGINISPKQLDQTDIYEFFQSSIRRNGASAQWIDIEITEEVAMDGDLKAAQLHECFQKKGVSISIDDFGTGYSSLGYLKMFSLDRVKIAKPLIDNIATDEFDLKIVSSIIMLAKSLGIRTISEGVENKEQFDILLELGCDQVQGYYLGKPMPPQDFQETVLKKIAPAGFKGKPM